jgi:hypothetical protein
MREAKAQGAAEAVIHCGDVIGTQTVRPAMGADLTAYKSVLPYAAAIFRPSGKPAC